jgi:hypothetical protein
VSSRFLDRIALLVVDNELVTGSAISAEGEMSEISYGVANSPLTKPSSAVRYGDARIERNAGGPHGSLLCAVDGHGEAG